jgi:transcriptional regulator with XRE-family HTH domain
VRTTPGAARRWLALELKRARVRSKLSQADVAAKLGCQVPKVSLMESGQRRVQQADLLVLLELYDVPEDDGLSLLEAAEAVRGKGWWERRGKHALYPAFELYLGLEQGATQLDTYRPAVIEGLLQTADYAKGVFQQAFHAVDENQMEQMVDIRIKRQRILEPGSELKRLRAILDEAVLRHVVGDHETMSGQLDHLVGLAARDERVVIQVVPFEAPGAVAASEGAFTILTFHWTTDPGLIFMEQASSFVFRDHIDAVADYRKRFETLRVAALTPENSIELIRHAASQFAR